MKEEDKNLNYWKVNAKESYMKTPICVLRYISELEKEVEKLTLPVVNKSCDSCIKANNCKEVGAKIINGILCNLYKSNTDRVENEE